MVYRLYPPHCRHFPSLSCTGLVFAAARGRLVGIQWFECTYCMHPGFIHLLGDLAANASIGCNLHASNRCIQRVGCVQWVRCIPDHRGRRFVTRWRCISWRAQASACDTRAHRVRARFLLRCARPFVSCANVALHQGVPSSSSRAFSFGAFILII